jgi:hypothetical protein
LLVVSDQLLVFRKKVDRFLDQVLIPVCRFYILLIEVYKFIVP